MNPRQIAARLEARRRIDAASVDHFAGYALLGIAFESGHVIAVRRATATSIGPPFSTVWLRSPGGDWTVLTNVDAARSCPRYIGATAVDVRSDDIELKWTGAGEVGITARRARLNLALRLTRTPATALLGAVLRLLPASLLRRSDATLRGAMMLTRLLGLGEVVLLGRTASGHAYRVRPRALWRVTAAAAVLEGRDLGPMVQVQGAMQLGLGTGSTAGGLFAAGYVELSTDAVAAALNVGGAWRAGTTQKYARDALLWRVLTRPQQ